VRLKRTVKYSDSLDELSASSCYKQV